MSSTAIPHPEIESAQETIVSDADKSSFWAVTLLVSGTCIGGGMLALPVQTAGAGFVLSFFGILLCWAFMTYTGLLLVEATLWIKNETHFSSLSRILVGNGTRILAMLVYLFMNYTSLIAYTAGGAQLIGDQVKAHLGMTLSYDICCVLFTVTFGSMIWLGAKTVGKLNFVFMIGLVVTYFALVGLGSGHIDTANLAFRPAWREGLGIFSMILATFSFQMVVPSLCYQLNYDARKLKKAIIFGTTIPFAVYILWLLVIHGVVPLDGPEGLASALENGSSATVPLRAHFDHWTLSAFADFFAFFAVVTSYLGLSLGLFYFLKDCFSEIKFSIGKSAIILASIIPTMLLAIKYPNALISCLDMSGGYGDTLLSGLIPIAMIWMGRYNKKMTGEFTVPGGKPALIAAAAFYLFVLALQFY